MSIPTKRKVTSDILVISNPDKSFHETWKPRIRNGCVYNRHPINIPHPSRWVLFGPPGTGKTTVVLNGVIRQSPPFERIFVIHVDGRYTKEYDKLENFTRLTSIPRPEWWNGEEKTLVILDDLEYRLMSRTQKSNLDRLFGYVSTHKNISVYLTAQDGFNIPACVRRSGNVWILWKGRDIDSMRMLARKGGLKKTDLDALFLCYDITLRDSIWLDTTPFSPYPIRLNGTHIIDDDELEFCRNQLKLNDQIKRDNRHLEVTTQNPKNELLCDIRE